MVKIKTKKKEGIIMETFKKNMSFVYGQVDELREKEYNITSLEKRLAIKLNELLDEVFNTPAYCFDYQEKEHKLIELLKDYKKTGSTLFYNIMMFNVELYHNEKECDKDKYLFLSLVTKNYDLVRTY